ncbi:MAG: hypothetical protein IPK98_06150 [Chloracidobacterium sp.]|nr:hypothetical protein [Chloracidobacterium sp.]
MSKIRSRLCGGAHDFIGKPVKLEELRVTLRNALETETLRKEVKHARTERSRGFSFDEIIGDSGDDGTSQRSRPPCRRIGGRLDLA